MFVKTNTVDAIKAYYFETLESIYSPSEIGVLLEIVFEHFIKYSKLDVKTKGQNRLSESELLNFHFTLKRLKLKEPIQYILEEAPFMGMMLKVDKNVLIPRPETEELVDWISQVISPNSTILDIGTGSGCIPIGLKKLLPNSIVSGIDIDKNALTIAKENANKYKLDITFNTLDILTAITLETTFDCIVSNPPYIGLSEMKTMDEQVVNFEPHLALFVEDNDLMIFYKKISFLAIAALNDNGHLFFESNQVFSEEVKEIMLDCGFKNVVIKCDINNNPRMIHGQKI